MEWFAGIDIQVGAIKLVEALVGSLPIFRRGDLRSDPRGDWTPCKLVFALTRTTVGSNVGDSKDYDTLIERIS